MKRSRLKLFVVQSLNSICTWIDDLAYRPAVVKLTERLPRWWSCQLTHLSMRLDDRWGTGFWRSEDAPAAPKGLCDACGRRAAWLVVGGTALDEPEPLDGGDRDYLDSHPVHLCGWCRLLWSSRPASRVELEPILAEARDRSVCWRWSHRAYVRDCREEEDRLLRP